MVPASDSARSALESVGRHSNRDCASTIWLASFSVAHVDTPDRYKRVAALQLAGLAGTNVDK